MKSTMMPLKFVGKHVGWTRVNNEDGTFGVSIPSGHDLFYDLEGSCPECFAIMDLIATAPDLLAEGLALANEVRAALTLLNETTAGEPLGWTNIACLERHLEAMDKVTAKARGEVADDTPR